MVQLSLEQEQILVGSILGDACIEQNGINHRVKFDHSLAQEQYLFWKYKKLFDLSTKIRYKDVLDPRTEKKYSHVMFNTRTSSRFSELHEIFYRDRRKLIPKNIVEIFNSPIALATWYLDDGAKRTDCNALRIHTNSYPRANQELLVEMLQFNYQIKSRIHKVKNEEYVLYIPSGQALRFCEMIYPIVKEIPSMRYKILDRVTTEENVAQAA